MLEQVEAVEECPELTEYLNLIENAQDTLRLAYTRNTERAFEYIADTIGILERASSLVFTLGAMEDRGVI